MVPGVYKHIAMLEHENCVYDSQCWLAGCAQEAFMGLGKGKIAYGAREIKLDLIHGTKVKLNSTLELDYSLEFHATTNLVMRKKHVPPRRCMFNEPLILQIFLHSPYPSLHIGTYVRHLLGE
jgi:hypothetical protein